jgi:hypothetical protein
VKVCADCGRILFDAQIGADGRCEMCRVEPMPSTKPVDLTDRQWAAIRDDEEDVSCR